MCGLRTTFVLQNYKVNVLLYYSLDCFDPKLGKRATVPPNVLLYYSLDCFDPKLGKRATVPPNSPLSFPLGFLMFSSMVVETSSGRKMN
jgi:hypothetical protein